MPLCLPDTDEDWPWEEEKTSGEAVRFGWGQFLENECLSPKGYLEGTP